MIAGGDGKGQDFAPLAVACRGIVRHAVLIGRDREALAKALAFGEQTHQQQTILVRQRCEQIAGLARLAHQHIEFRRVFRAVAQFGLDV